MTKVRAMTWRLETRRGRKIAAGTLEQMLTHLKYLLRDGEYRLVGSELTIPVRRYQGVVYPFDKWEGGPLAEVVNRYRSGS
jgi:hypothetical protein